MNLKCTLPTQILFSDRKKIKNLQQTIKNLGKNSAIIIREYDLESKARSNFAKKILQISSRNHIIIGKDLNLARELKADGVHFSDLNKLPISALIAKKSNPKLILSFSCHCYKTLLWSLKLNIFDIIFISPVFQTTSHENKKNIGIINLGKMTTKNSLGKKNNIYALGGINNKNFKPLKKIGIKGFGAIDFFNH